jgi:oligoribonuclease
LDGNLVWIDLEMTGLDPEHAVIIEIASLVTTTNLDVVATGPAIAIHQPARILDTMMDPWSRDTHTASGLLDKVRASGVSAEQAEEATIQFLSSHTGPGESPLCGNSVWQDRRFLVKYMPRLNDFLHHRNIDVSTLKELVRRWYPHIPWFTKQNTHTAVADIHESIEELRFYRQRVFVEK